MPSIELVTARPTITRHPKMMLISEQGQRIQIPYAPVEVTHSDIGMGFTEISRPGRAPLLEKTGRRLPTLSMTLEATIDGTQTSIENLLATFRRLANDGDRVTISYGPTEAGWWRLTNLEISSVQRQHGSNEITWASCTLTFQRADDALEKISPLTGGATDVGQRSATDDTATSGTGATITIKTGETLTAIAARVWGTPSRWPEIAKANGIRDPRRVPAGTVLQIP